jgi:hypothetical protein
VKNRSKVLALPLLLSSMLGGCAVYTPAYGPAYDAQAYPQPVYAAPPVYQAAPVYVGPPVFFNFGYRSGGGYRHHRYGGRRHYH